LTLSPRPIFFRLSTFKLHRYPYDFSQEGIYAVCLIYIIYRHIYSNVFVFFTPFRDSPVVFFLHSFRFVSLFRPCNIITTICYYYYYYYYSLLRARRFRRRANRFVSGFTGASSRHDFTVMSHPRRCYFKPEQFRAYDRVHLYPGLT